MVALGGGRFLMSEVTLYGGRNRCLPRSQSIWAHHFGEPGLVPAPKLTGSPKLTGLYREASMST